MTAQSLLPSFIALHPLPSSQPALFLRTHISTSTTTTTNNGYRPPPRRSSCRRTPRRPSPPLSPPRCCIDDDVVVVELKTVPELQKAVAQPGSVSVLSVVTPECPACAYAARLYHRFAREFIQQPQVDRPPSPQPPQPPLSRPPVVRFFQIDAERPALAPLCRRMAFDAVPMWQLFVTDNHGTVFAIDRIVGPRKFHALRQCVRDIADNGFDLDMYELDHKTSIQLF